MLLQSELCGSDIEMKKSKNEKKFSENKFNGQKNLLRYSSSPTMGPNKIDVSPYSLSPIGFTGQKLLSTPKTKPRKISKTPFKVLEAPSIQDDFYLNLVDWSSQDLLAVGLGSSVYIWNARTSQVTRVADMPAGDTVASIAWNTRGNVLGIGSNQGSVQTWQICEGQSKKIREFKEHNARVGVLSWNDETLSSGSRDRNIYHRDVRSKEGLFTKLKGHSQEVCGLKWSHDSQFLASGGNDNKLLVWDQRATSPIIKYADHTAVKFFWNDFLFYIIISFFQLRLSRLSLGLLIKEACWQVVEVLLTDASNSEMFSTNQHSDPSILEAKSAIWHGPKIPTSWSAHMDTLKIKLLFGIIQISILWLL